MTDSWEEKCVQLADHTYRWFWAEFSADAYFAPAHEEVPPLEDHIRWFALPTDRTGIKTEDGGSGHVILQLRKAAEYLRNAAGQIDAVVTMNLLVDWEGDAADSVKKYISSVKTSCEHLAIYIEALQIAAQAHGDRLYAVEADLVAAIGLAKNAVQEGNDKSGQIASMLGETVLAVATGGPGAGAVALVSSALKTSAVEAFDQTFQGDGVYATRELKNALSGLRDRLSTAISGVGTALNELAREVAQARIPAEVHLPRVVQDPAFDPSQFRIDDPDYSHQNVSNAPLFSAKDLIPGTEDGRELKRSRDADLARLEAQAEHYEEQQKGAADAGPR